MKRNVIRTLFALCITSAMILSCEPLEPSTYTETFFRIGTVKIVKGKPVFNTDYLHETFSFENVKDSADMARFNFKDGDRLRTSITLKAVGSMNNNKLTLNEALPIKIRSIEKAHPNDTLNFFYYFAKFDMSSLIYPSIWSEGHLINIAPVCFVPRETSKANYYLYPVDFSGDTLILKLYSDIPDCDVSLNPNYAQKLLCYDISSIRDSAATPQEQVLRDTILARMDRLQQEKIVVTVTTPDTVRAKNSKVFDKDGKNIPYLRPVPGLPVSTVITLDF